MRWTQRCARAWGHAQEDGHRLALPGRVSPAPWYFAAGSVLIPGPCLSFPPVLLELTSSPHPSHRLTPFQLLDIAPTLLIDSVREPLPITQLASLLLAGINDPSIDVRVEALKAMRSVILEGVTGKERGEIGPALILEAYKVGLDKACSLPKLTIVDIEHAHRFRQIRT